MITFYYYYYYYYYQTKPGSPSKNSISTITSPIGIITRITSEIIKERIKYLNGKIPTKIPLLLHIENPIFSIARAGFGLLSSSLGRSILIFFKSD